MTELDQIPLLLDREARQVLVPALSGIRRRSRRRRQRRTAGALVALALVATPVALNLRGGAAQSTGPRLGTSPGYTLDVYPQPRSDTPRTTGEPVFHLKAVSARVMIGVAGEGEVELTLDEQGRTDYASIDPGQMEALVVNGRLLAAPLLIERITSGVVQLTAPSDPQDQGEVTPAKEAHIKQLAVDLAHEFTDNVVVEPN
ncbi:MAG: hypothetical protein JWO22_2109 [Frankiales bacterium]|nr:hypothetical protein [Frankiales bacterium]